MRTSSGVSLLVTAASLFALGAVLFVITFTINTVADVALRRGKS